MMMQQWIVNMWIMAMEVTGTCTGQGDDGGENERLKWKKRREDYYKKKLILNNECLSA